MISVNEISHQYEYQAPIQALVLTVKSGLVIELTEVCIYLKVSDKPQSTVEFLDVRYKSPYK